MKNRLEDKPTVTGYRCYLCHKAAYRESDGVWYHVHRHKDGRVCEYGGVGEVYSVDIPGEPARR